MNITYEFLLQIAVMLLSAGAVYGAIRADIKSIHNSVTGLKEAGDKLGEKFDKHIDWHIGEAKDRHAI